MSNTAVDLEGEWIASRFNIRTADVDGTLLLYNSYVGAFARIGAEELATVDGALQNGFSGFPRGILAELVLNGFFVPRKTDELHLADELHQAQFTVPGVLQLVLLPNENCNFRCKYCAQSFSRNRMKREVIEGVVRYVANRAPTLAVFSVGWFGGEPLTATDIIEEMSSRFQQISERYGVQYSASMTTNGYLLRAEVARMLFRAEVRRFQITLDGPPEEHDRLRVLADGHSPTSEKILSNLMWLRASDESFRVVIRVNFDSRSVPGMNRFLDMLETKFGNDKRFVLDFHPVGRWGGPNDEHLEVCGIDDGRFMSLDLAERAARKGFDLAHLKAQLKPFGSRCYAANPHSFVIGSDGTIYKCTVAFEDPRNQIGRVTGDGQFLIDASKHALWISSGEEKDEGCRACAFRPSCHGNACPLHRMDTGNAPCPTVKHNLSQALRILSADLVRNIKPLPDSRSAL